MPIFVKQREIQAAAGSFLTFLNTNNLKATVMKKGKWEIKKISNVEIMITDGFVCSYGYISECKTKMYYDTIYFPLYIQKAALKFAAKNIESIYN